MCTYLTIKTSKPLEDSKFQVHQHVTSGEPTEYILFRTDSWTTSYVFACSLRVFILPRPRIYVILHIIIRNLLWSISLNFLTCPNHFTSTLLSQISRQYPSSFTECQIQNPFMPNSQGFIRCSPNYLICKHNSADILILSHPDLTS